MCLYPKLVENPKYKVTKKNGGDVPVLRDRRIGYVPIGCGKCMECMKKKSNNWKVRLKEEIRTNNTGKFITLTFSNEALKEIIEKGNIDSEGYERENDIAKQGVRWFFERWRKKYKKSVRHWLVTELGHKNTERIHLHGLLFTNESHKEIEKLWKYGNVVIGEYVNEKTINYISKYVTKIDIDHKEYQPKILCSAGIGKSYIDRPDARNNKYNGKDTIEVYKDRSGYKSSLPIYYRNYIYTEDEREQLWIDKLDKNVRYVCGEKVDISKGDETYYKLVDYRDWETSN